MPDSACLGRRSCSSVRTGRWRWRACDGPWDAASLAAGLDASCLAWLRDRDVATLGSDCRVRRPAVARRRRRHADPRPMAIVALGLHLMDNLDLTRWRRPAPRRAAGPSSSPWRPWCCDPGAASPVNPIAVFLIVPTRGAQQCPRRINGEVELHYDTFGDPVRPRGCWPTASGRSASTTPPSGAQMFAAEGYHVVQFDNREVGLVQLPDGE